MTHEMIREFEIFLAVANDTTDETFILFVEPFFYRIFKAALRR
jgi:hypothetical protein